MSGWTVVVGIVAGFVLIAISEHNERRRRGGRPASRPRPGGAAQTVRGRPARVENMPRAVSDGVTHAVTPSPPTPSWSPSYCAGPDCDNLVSGRDDQRYCSGKCRTAAWRARQRAR